MDEVEAFDQQVLDALLEGFKARAGTKERFQALSEYEVARRVGIVDYSYVAYEESPERQQVRAALARLQRLGQVHSQSISGRYETFVPVEAPVAPSQLPPGAGEHGPSGESGARDGMPLSEALRPKEAPLPTTFEGRLDEVIRLLRSIDARLERIERG